MIKKLSAFILLAVIVFGAYRGIATLNTSAKEIEKIDAEVSHIEKDMKTSKRRA